MRARLNASGPVLIPGLLAVALLLIWALNSGGYPARAGTDAHFEPDAWYLGALAAVGLLVAVAVGFGAARLRVSRLTAIALAAFAAYVLIAYASVAWAEVPGDAFDGANRTLVYFGIFALFALLPWRRPTAEVALAAFAIGGGLVALITTLRLGTAGHPSAGFYHDGRLAWPITYQNATAAFFTMVALTGVGVGARRGLHFAVRGAALASAGLSVQLAVLAQSRGWLFTLPLVLIVVLIVVPGRLRFVLFAAGPVLATLAILQPLLAVYRSAGYHGEVRPPAVLDQLLAQKGSAATSAMLLTALVLLALATLAAWLDSRTALTPRMTRNAGRAGAVVVVLLVLGGAGAGLVATHGRVGAKISKAWKSFKSTDTNYGTSSRFTQLGSARYDFWRVSLDVFAEHPVGGIGQDNFAEAYALRRRTDDETRWTHSLEMRLLVHTGLVGAISFGVFLLAALAGALRGRRPRRRAGDPAPEDPGGDSRRGLAAIALLPLVVWLIHGSIDWLWEFPALAGAALGFLGLALSLGSPLPGARAAGERRVPSRARRRLETTAIAVVGVLALLLLAVPYVGEREVASGLSATAGDPARAYAALGRGADLEPLDAQPPLVAGLLAWKSGREDLGRASFEESLRRNKRQWLPPFLLGIAASSRGKRDEARTWLVRARALNPRDPLLGAAVARASGRHPMTLAQAVTGLSDRYHRLFPR